VLIICLLGVSEIYSATLHTKFEGCTSSRFLDHGGRGADVPGQPDQLPGLLEMVPWMYGLSLVSLSLCCSLEEISWARRWIDFRVFHFQPSEWVKLILILTMAKYFAEYRETNCPSKN